MNPSALSAKRSSKNQKSAKKSNKKERPKRSLTYDLEEDSINKKCLRPLQKQNYKEKSLSPLPRHSDSSSEEESVSHKINPFASSKATFRTPNLDKNTQKPQHSHSHTSLIVSSPVSALNSNDEGAQSILLQDSLNNLDINIARSQFESETTFQSNINSPAHDHLKTTDKEFLIQFIPRNQILNFQKESSFSITQSEHKLHSKLRSNSLDSLLNQSLYKPNNKPILTKENSKIITNMSTFNLTNFHKLVPQFNGNEDDLDRFIDTCDIQHFSCTEEVGRTEFMNALRSKLIGRAYDFFKKATYTDWPTFKTDLKKQFASPETFEGYHLKLTSLKQNDSSVREFADKIEKILYAMNKTSSEIKVNNATGTEFFKAQNDKLAIKSFINGLKDSLRNVLRARKYTSIREAISDAVELEIEDSSRDIVSIQTTPVENSKNDEKPTKDDALSKSLNKNSEGLIKLTQNRNNSSNIAQNSQNRSLVCNRCGKFNHTSNVCRARFPINPNMNFYRPNQNSNFRTFEYNYNRSSPFSNQIPTQGKYPHLPRMQNPNFNNVNHEYKGNFSQPQFNPNTNTMASNNNFRFNHQNRDQVKFDSQNRSTNNRSNGIQMLDDSKNERTQSQENDGMTLNFLTE